MSFTSTIGVAAPVEAGAASARTGAGGWTTPGCAGGVGSLIVVACRRLLGVGADTFDEVDLGSLRGLVGGFFCRRPEVSRNDRGVALYRLWRPLGDLLAEVQHDDA